MEYKYELVKTDDHLPIKVILHTSDKQLFIPRHWHENVEISYVLAGKIDQIYIDGREYRSRQGDIVLINSNSIHSFSVSMGKDRMATTIFISYEFMKTIDTNYDQIVFNCVSVDEKDPMRLAKFAELRLLLDSIVAAYLTKDNDSLAHINLTGLSYQLAYLLLKNFKVTNKHSISIQTNKYLDRLTAITNYIKENYNQDLSIDLLSSMFNLSAEYFSRFFIKHLGMTVLNYIYTIRLEKSFPDLMNTDYPIIQIALKHGFPSEKSYTRVFKTVYQMTPNQYRKKHHSKNLVVEESSSK